MAFRKVQARLELDDDQREQLAPLFRIPQDTRPNNDEETNQRDSSAAVRADQSLFDELPSDLELWSNQSFSGHVCTRITTETVCDYILKNE